MALNIKDPQTDQLARELAAETGESITTALRTAISQRLAAERARKATAPVRDDLAEIIRRGRARPTLDARPADAIIGYGPDGLPA
jgi:antitoxin VapB